MDPWIIWLIISAALALIELTFGAFAAFCPAIGALIAAIASVCGLGIQWQIAAMIIGGGLSFALLTPLINKNSGNSTGYTSNMDALIGREAMVGHPYRGEGSLGRMRIDGDSWQIASADGKPIESKTLVKVVGYESIILKVEKVDRQ